MISWQRLLACLGLVAVATASYGGLKAEATKTHVSPVIIDNDDIGGVVSGTDGPEAGVWVIAETTELGTPRFVKSVVTDDRGRYVIPDLPTANYNVWARGYGLIDSPRSRVKPGQHHNISAVAAPDAASAAHYYPAIYWYVMMNFPPASDFDGASGIPAGITPGHWRKTMGNIDCVSCHQLGNESTRTIPAQFGEFASHEKAWMRRTQSGQAGAFMTYSLAGVLGGVPYKYFGDWTERVAQGELPTTQPERPQGVERNLVVTAWEWSEPGKYLHDLISSDRRDPTVNAFGKIYGSPEYSTDILPVLDPVANKVTAIKGEVRDPDMPLSLGFPPHAAAIEPMAPSAYWGNRQLWETRFNTHNAMFDSEARVWFSASIRGVPNPDWCKAGSSHPSAKVFPLEQSGRQAALLDQETGKFSFIDTCFNTHHLQFGYDENHTLWFSGTGPVAGWIDTKVWDETGDSAQAVGWRPYVLDYNGNGKLDEYSDTPEPGKDLRFDPGSGSYAVMPHPTDGSVWFTSGIFSGRPGFLRFDPETGLSEFFQVPPEALHLRGGDIDKNGVLFASGANGHLIEFDRSKCRGLLNGPTATGNHCSEGFTLHPYPGPSIDGYDSSGGSAEGSYYTWVDQHNAVGFGEDVPISTANLQDGFVAFKNGEMILMQVPYPRGFFAKGMDARIDDSDAGWKGRGLWSSSADRTPWLNELGKAARPLAVHIQVRPDPLAH